MIRMRKERKQEGEIYLVQCYEKKVERSQKLTLRLVAASMIGMKYTVL